MISEAGLFFTRANMGLANVDKEKMPKLFGLSKRAGRLAGMFGTVGALFGVIMAFIPGGDSPEIKLMKSEFGKLSEKIDTVAKSLDDTKNLIKLATQKALYIRYEQKLHYGFSQMERCLEKLDNVTCEGQRDCKRKKILVAQTYISSMDVRQSTEAILRGVTTDSVFGTSLLFLLKEETDCNIPKINLFANKVVALVTKGVVVSIFHNLLTKPSYNYLEDTVTANTMLLNLERKRHDIQDSCFKDFEFWMPRDVQKANSKFTSDIQNTNTKLLHALKMKYPWIHWHVITYQGSKPSSGFHKSIRSNLYSSSEKLNVHSFVIPTNKARVEKLNDKIKTWVKLTKVIGTYVNPKNSVPDVQKRIGEVFELKNQIQTFVLLQGDKWILGHFDDEIQQHTLGATTVKSQNVHVHNPTKQVLVAVSFSQLGYPSKCSNNCNNRGTCYVFPYSTQQGCRCEKGSSGEECEISDDGLKLKSVVDSLLENTMKLPTFASIQHAIEDTQLYLKTSTENIQESIKKLGDEIDKQFKNMGELISKKLEWFSVLLRYKDAIENLNYFHSLYKFSSLKSANTTELDIYKKHAQFSKKDEKQVAEYLLRPSGIRKWLYQINFLIVGKMGGHFNSHKPLIHMVMDRYKDRICFSDYKREVTRTFRQLSLLQLKGYILWSNAYSIFNRDSAVIARTYTDILKDQERSLQSGSCGVNIPHSKNMQNCTGGFFIHKSMDVTVSCNTGYFFPGKKFVY